MGAKHRSTYFWERTGMIEADSSEALRKACQYERKTESTKGQDERPLFGGALDSSHVTTGGLCRWKAINKEGRHVGLDFYDLLIEGDYTNYGPGTSPGSFPWVGVGVMEIVTLVPRTHPVVPFDAALN
jgi:hypothetical protein